MAHGPASYRLVEGLWLPDAAPTNARPILMGGRGYTEAITAGFVSADGDVVMGNFDRFGRLRVLAIDDGGLGLGVRGLVPEGFTHSGFPVIVGGEDSAGNAQTLQLDGSNRLLVVVQEPLSVDDGGGSITVDTDGGALEADITDDATRVLGLVDLGDDLTRELGNVDVNVALGEGEKSATTIRTIEAEDSDIDLWAITPSATSQTDTVLQAIGTGEAAKIEFIEVYIGAGVTTTTINIAIKVGSKNIFPSINVAKPGFHLPRAGYIGAEGDDVTYSKSATTGGNVGIVVGGKIVSV